MLRRFLCASFVLLVKSCKTDSFAGGVVGEFVNGWAPRTAFALLLAGFQCAAQLDTGAILGTVLNASGAVVPNAAVLVQNQGTGASSNLTADSSGSFIASLFPWGVSRDGDSAGIQDARE